MLGLYVHYPFCIKKCPYCDFNSKAAKIDTIRDNAYIKQLKKDFLGYKSFVDFSYFDSIYFGGGTPSLLAIENLQEFFSFLSSYIKDTTEISIEINPGTIDYNKLLFYKDLGINRVSLGVQSFNDASLKFLRRIHDAKTAIEACKLINKVGFKHFNIDIMHGLSYQNTDMMLSDLKIANDMGATHLSWYELTIEEDTYFAKYLPTLPSEDELFLGETSGFNLLESLGFCRYEISGFYKKDLGKPCTHNLIYWNYDDYLGIGAGAHGKITKNGVIYRKANSDSFDDFMAGKFASFKEVLKEDIPFEYVLNRFRLFKDIKKEEFELHTNLPFSYLICKLTKASSQGLVTLSGDSIHITQEGYVMLNEIISDFL